MYIERESGGVTGPAGIGRVTERPLPRQRLTPGVEERPAPPVVDAVGGDPDAARAVWAFAHGMTILELNGRFPAGAGLDRRGRPGYAFDG